MSRHQKIRNHLIKALQAKGVQVSNFTDIAIVQALKKGDK